MSVRPSVQAQTPYDKNLLQAILTFHLLSNCAATP